MFDSGYLFFGSGEVINHDKLSYLICAYTKLGLIIPVDEKALPVIFLKRNVSKRLCE